MNVRSVDVAGTPLRVRETGVSDCCPFVFWHSLGVGSNGSFLDIAAPEIAAAGYATIALDAPGYGGSPALPRDAYAIDALAQLLWDLVDALDAPRPLVLAEHSWGGTIAVTAAVLRPDGVRALVLFDSGHIDYADWPDARPETTIDELIAEIEADPLPGTWDELVLLLEEQGLDQDSTVAAWREGFDVGPDGSLRRLASTEVLAASRAGLMRKRTSEAWPAIAAARIPTLLLLATEPAETREFNAGAAERMREAMPQAEIRSVAGMRHAVFADLGTAAGTMVGDWLRTAGAVEPPAP